MHCVGYFLSFALELPIIAAVLWIIEYVGNAGMLRIVAYLMGFMYVYMSSILPEQLLMYRTSSASPFNSSSSPSIPTSSHLFSTPSLPSPRTRQYSPSSRLSPSACRSLSDACG